MRLLALFVLVVALLGAASGVARADDASEAQLHHDLGMELFGQHRYAEALDHFIASNRLVPNRNVVFNIAAIYRALHHPRDAYNWMEIYLHDFDLTDTERTEGTQLRDQIGAALAVVDVSSDPPGATIYVDRVELGSLGVLPRRIALEAGHHTLILQSPGRHEARVEVDATSGHVVSASASLSAITGHLVVHSEPAGADVRIEGSDAPLGVTPLEVDLPVGDVLLEIRLAGFADERRSVRLEDGATATVELALQRDVSALAILSAVTTPEGAELLLDGESIGAAPLTREGVAPGTHHVEVRAPGHDPWSVDALFEAGAATRVRARLRDPQGGPPEAIAITGYTLGAALGAAAIGTAVAGLLARDAFFATANPTRADYDNVGALNLAADVLGALGAVVLAGTFVFDVATGPPPPSSGTFDLER